MTRARVTIRELDAAYRAGTYTPVSVISGVLNRIDSYADPAVWISRFPDPEILQRAQELTNNSSARHLPLYGIPFAVKDNIDCMGLPTTAGCPAFSFRPEENATVVQKLLDAGAILIGKTNLDQFATGLVGTRSPYGTPRSVFNADYVAGGSSSGSAVAVGAGLVAFSLGTDTAGSGRVPAAFNDIVGLKPTRGIASMAGVVPACRTLDCVSIFANDAEEASKALTAIQGFDVGDSFSRASPDLPLPEPFRFGTLTKDDFISDEAETWDLYQDALARLRSIGGGDATIEYAPFRAVASLLYGGPWVAERLAAIEGFATHHESDMEPTVRKIITSARTMTAVDVFRGQYQLQALKRETDRAWKKIDILALPTTPSHPTAAEVAAAPVEANAHLGVYTNFVNLLDYCAIALPGGFKRNGMPFGITLIAPAFHDAALAALGSRFLASGTQT
jgi:allophanate hydrolase